ncbi:hypothetical protein [Leucobacter massiliensis]|uniref:Polysaccharide biosynthesis protein n=1 Tax=Leucobacter massiliensis TaxID=1686285 RepID=A0A2S9QKU7_9MICO|nr:hypothetical protein [Leucobacter massiliensis]PRI10214.1 hypothetical protein B4915_12445 [Leucobacter massiliensis]
MTDSAARTRSGLILVLAGTVVSAASSFIVLLIVAPALGPAGYAQFSVYWAALFMVVAVLFGVQQESTRAVAAAPATDEDDPARGPLTSVLAFALVVAATLLVAVGASSPVWSEALFGPGAGGWGFPLALAVASYALVAATNGILAGSGRWGPFSLLAVIDGALRLALVALALALGLDGTALAWAVAIPFPVSLAIVVLGNRRVIRARAIVAGTPGRLAANTARTLAASVATAILINGFPVFLSLFGRTDAATLGAVILAVTLTRAPILVPLTALQSMLIARLSAVREGRGRLLAAVLGIVAALTGLVAAFVWLWGGPLLARFFGEGFVLSSATLAGLVAAAGALGVLTATGAAALARERHTAFAAGWLAAAVLALALLALLPLPLEARVVIALLAGPLLGAVVHLAVTRDR